MNEPKKEPDEPNRSETHSRNSILLVIDKPGDRTRRPRRKNNPRFWPKDVPFPPPEEGNGDAPPQST